jgi:FtsP/CotA-like multicopper oxidase with cupredoxin domain
MPDIKNAKRRTLLRASLTSALLAGAGWPPASRTASSQSNPTHAPFVPDLEVELRAKKDQLAIWPGSATHVWRYDGKVTQGDAGALVFLSDGYAPVLRVRRGQKVRIDFINELPEPTIIHWHGLLMPAAMDGHPRNAISPGQHFRYEFEVQNRAGTYWFHAHPDGRTGAQIYFGQAGFLIVGDEEEAALKLPEGANDVPLMIQDRKVNGDNQFAYLSQPAGGMMGRGGMMDSAMMGNGGMGDMMAQMMGFLGDQILVNGRPDFVLPVATRAYRLRLLNASNARIYKLAWNDGSPLTVIGTDGGLLDAPLPRRYVTLAPAERIDVWVDFSHQPLGTRMTLESREFAGDVAMGGMMGNTELPMGARFPVLNVSVTQHSDATSVLPTHLARVPAVRPQESVNFSRPRVFGITMGMMTWGIDGRRFEMDSVTASETVRRETTEIWEFRNEASMMLMAHSMHVHGVQFRVLKRLVATEFSRARDSVAGGYVDEGWKDTVLIMPGERTRLLIRFGAYTGIFLYHCHMLEHEDSGLMRNYLIRA